VYHMVDPKYVSNFYAAWNIQFPCRSDLVPTECQNVASTEFRVWGPDFRVWKPESEGKEYKDMYEIVKNLLAYPQTGLGELMSLRQHP